MEVEFEQNTISKWFKSFDNLNDLTTDEFLNSINDKTSILILCQYGGDNDIGLYAVIKGKGLYGFTTKKNCFFEKYDVKLKDTTFIINDEQTIWTFINIFDVFLKENNKNINKIKISFYENIINNLIR